MNVFNSNSCQETLRSYLDHDCVVSQGFAWYALNWNGEFSSCKTTFSFEYLYKLITFLKKAKRLKSLYGQV